MKTIKTNVSIFIFNSKNKLLLESVKLSQNMFEWKTLGGSIKFGESVEESASRIFNQTIGVKINSEKIRVLGFTNDVFSDEGKHHLTIHCRIDISNDKLLEPLLKKNKKWGVYDVGFLPSNLFLPVQNFFKTKQRLG